MKTAKQAKARANALVCVCPQVLHYIHLHNICVKRNMYNVNLFVSMGVPTTV